MADRSAPTIAARVPQELVDAARAAAGLPDASDGELVRYALATVAGVAEPESVAYVRRGPKTSRAQSSAQPTGQAA